MTAIFDLFNFTFESDAFIRARERERFPRKNGIYLANQIRKFHSVALIYGEFRYIPIELELTFLVKNGNVRRFEDLGSA